MLRLPYSSGISFCVEAADKFAFAQDVKRVFGVVFRVPVADDHGHVLAHALGPEGGLREAGGHAEEVHDAAVLCGQNAGHLAVFARDAVDDDVREFAAGDALVAHTLRQPGNKEVRSVNPVVGETNDGYLNDIRAQRVRAEDVFAALAAADGGPVAEGSIGAGTGTRCLGWKGGIGTASRRLPDKLGGYTLGALVQTNFSGILTVGGAPVGQELGRYYLQGLRRDPPPEAGSCMIVLATDAPLNAHQLKRLAKRALLGLAAVGSPMTHGSGDYVIAFSTARQVRIAHQAAGRTQTRTLLRDEALSPLFQAARETTEEAILNSLLKATTVTGYQGHDTEAVPLDRLIEICRRYGAIRS